MNETHAHGRAPIHWAVVGMTPGNEAIVSLLLSAGAEVNLPDSDGETPFYNAQATGNLRLIQLLRDAGGRYGQKKRALYRGTAEKRANYRANYG